MKNIKIIKVVSFMLLFSLILLSFSGCNKENNENLAEKDNFITETKRNPNSSVNGNTLTDKENFINQLNQDFNSSKNGEAIEFTADPFAQLATLSAVFLIDFKIIENNVYINDILYDSIKVIYYPEILYNKSLLTNANNSTTHDEVIIIMQKMQNSKTCYMLETESDVAKSKKIAVYIIDEKYYFVSFSQKDEIIRIHHIDE